MTVEIRPLRRDEMAGMIALAEAEGWNPGLADAEAFHAADRGGFLGLFRDESDPAAVISMVRYGDDLAFLGLYIVRPDARGQGLGYRLWQAAIELAGSRPIGLDGVVAQQENYRRSGFELKWQNVRYTGPAPRLDHSADGLTRIDGTLIDAVLAYDRPCFGAGRASFLRTWLTLPGHRGLAAHRPDGSIAGYGVVRPCTFGYKVGPLFADDPETAARLLDGLIAPLAGEPVTLDVPEPNPAATSLARSYGWSPVFQTARMVRGRAPTLPLDRIFGITTFELG